ncbi:hypothetical protein ACH5RR_005709 [Cinchona calisaya]|uniref:MD-2-related lipid-recognition domain-containing protein n=1 Tax=Cinchona calisaya TaxID=153742 RepID=A0ABD3AM91_9GENT
MARSQLNLTIAVAVIFLSIGLLVPSTSAIDFRYCDKKGGHSVNVSGVEIDPYPVTRNKETTFKISASTDKPITGGKLVIEVTYIWFHVRTETHDLCTETSCPVSAGDFQIGHTQVLPGYTPPGSYTLEMKLEDGNKKQLTCIEFDFSIGFLESEAVADS